MRSRRLTATEFRRLLEDWPPSLLLALLVANLGYRLVLKFKSRYVLALSVVVGLMWRLHMG